MEEYLVDVLSAECEDLTALAGELLDFMDTLSEEEQYEAMKFILTNAKILPETDKKIGRPSLSAKKESSFHSLSDAVRSLITQFYKRDTDTLAKKLWDFLQTLEGDERCFALSRIILDCRIPHVVLDTKGVIKRVRDSLKEMQSSLARKVTAVHSIIFHLDKNLKSRSASLALLFEDCTVEERTVLLSHVMRETRESVIYEFMPVFRPEVIMDVIAREKTHCPLLMEQMKGFMDKINEANEE